MNVKGEGDPGQTSMIKKVRYKVKQIIARLFSSIMIISLKSQANNYAAIWLQSKREHRLGRRLSALYGVKSIDLTP